MKKTYKSKASSLGIVVRTKNGSRVINFTKSSINKKGLMGCAFTTDDKTLQKAIESHPYFGRKLTPYIWTDDIEPKEEEVCTTNPIVEPTIIDCATVAEAKAILMAEPYNLPKEEVSSKLKILALQEELNVKFTNL